METNILEYFGKTNASYLHAHGKKSTQLLISLLNVKNNEKILEIGTGSGATLVKLSSRYSKTTFHGVELSPIMYRSALKRQHFSFLKNEVILIETPFPLPFGNNSYDKIYIESVLAIQEGDDLKELLKEIKRILKPKGVLVFNETIWLNSTSRATAIGLNKLCKKSFGIIQANDRYLHLKDWKLLLEKLDFNIKSITHIEKELPLVTQKKSYSFRIILSRVYDLSGKIKLITSPKLKQDWNQFSLKMDNINSSNSPIMEGVLFQVYNLK